MKRILVLLVVLLGSLGLTPARAATPATLSFAGRLSTAQGPVNGTVSVTFTIFDAQTGGTNLWTETHPTLTATQGLVFAELGSTTPLGTAFDASEAWLELVVNGELLTPRVKLLAVPYALRAAQAEQAALADQATHAAQADKLGALTEADVQKKMTAGNGIAITNGTTVSLNPSGCTSGQVLKFNGTSFSCANPPGFTNCAWSVDGSTSQNPVAICPAGKVAISGGCAPAAISIRLVTSRPFPTNISTGTPTASGWECFFDTSAGNTAYAYCCTLNP